MKAKDLAEELLKNPEFEVEMSLWVYKEDHRIPTIETVKIVGIADVGYSDKVIVLDGEYQQPTTKEEIDMKPIYDAAWERGFTLNEAPNGTYQLMNVDEVFDFSSLEELREYLGI